MWFRKKRRRERGPYTPQALALNWKIFCDDHRLALSQLNVPDRALVSQDAFESFLRLGMADDGVSWQPATDEASDRLRHLTWRYRERTKRRFGPSFLESGHRSSRLDSSELSSILQTSSRWGANDQPEDPQVLAGVLASLPVYSAEMRREDTLVVRFLRPLVSDEVRLLLSAAGYSESEEESPFPKDEPPLEAVLWWD